MKDLQRELEDSRAAQKEVQAAARESERKSKAMEADIVQLHEVTVVKNHIPDGIIGMLEHRKQPSPVCPSRCCQQLNELASRRRRKETSSLRSWPATPESRCLAKDAGNRRDKENVNMKNVDSNLRRQTSVSLRVTINEVFDTGHVDITQRTVRFVLMVENTWPLKFLVLQPSSSSIFSSLPVDR